MQTTSNIGLDRMSDEVQTNRLKLRTPNERDAGELTRLIGDWEVAKWLARVPYPYELDDAYAFIGNVRTTTSSNCGVNCFIDLDGTLIGGAGLSADPLDHPLVGCTGPCALDHHRLHQDPEQPERSLSD